MMNPTPSDYRTEVCRKFLLGECTRGWNCRFFHPLDPPPAPFQPVPTAPFTVAAPISWPNLYAYSPPAPMPPPRPNPHWSENVGSVYRTSNVYPSPPLSAANTSMSPTRLTTQAFRPTFSPPTNPQASLPQRNSSLFKPLSWRTTPCKHFTKTRGWCPLGDACNYIHDLSLPTPDGIGVLGSRLSTSSMPVNNIFDEEEDSHNAGAHGSERVVGGGVTVGSRSSHCWAYVQGYCRIRNCRYLHPRDIGPYKKYTPCAAWPNCKKGPSCEYKHTESVRTNLASTRPQAPPPLPPPPPPRIGNFPSPFDLPPGPQEVFGAMYYPFATAPPAMAPPPPPLSTPVFQYHEFASPYQPQASPVYELASRPSEPINTEQSAPRGAVAATQLDDLSSFRYPALPKSNSTPVKQTPVALEDFPYDPPKNQRSGHARRISVALKPERRENSLDLGDLEIPGISPRATHAARNSWAAFSWDGRSFPKDADPPPLP